MTVVLGLVRIVGVAALFGLIWSMGVEWVEAFAEFDGVGQLLERLVRSLILAILVFLPIFLLERSLTLMSLPSVRSTRRSKPKTRRAKPITSERLDKAKALRAQILDNADAAARAALAAKIDAVVKVLRARERLLARTTGAIEAVDREALIEQEASLRAQPVEGALELADELSSELEQVQLLEVQRAELEVHAKRLLSELRQLNLAVLSAGVGGALLESAGVRSALQELDRTTREIDQRAAAATELSQLLG